MNPPSEDIMGILDGDSTLGLEIGTDLFVSEMPGTPDACVAVFDTGGYDPEANYTYWRPTISVRVRGAKGGYVVAHNLAQQIAGAIHGLANYGVGSTRYVGIWQEGDIMFLGYDDNHRPLLSMNFRLHRTTA